MAKFKLCLTIFLFSLVIGFSSCNGNKAQSDENSVAIDTTEDVSNTVLNVEQIITTDREEMYLKFGDNYRWYETGILLKTFMDDDNASSDPEMIVNVFQVMKEYGDNSFDTWVYKIQHFEDGTVSTDSVQGFWIEDNPLNNDEIKLTYTKAYEQMMKVNYPKAHSRQICLRDPVGPLGCNAQYVFGNISTQIWIDAKTGDATDSCPAFPREEGLTYAFTW